MPVPQLLRLAGAGQPLRAELPDGFQQPVPGPVTCVTLPRQHRLIDQPDHAASTSPVARPSPAHTLSAASRSNSPANTEQRAGAVKVAGQIASGSRTEVLSSPSAAAAAHGTWAGSLTAASSTSQVPSGKARRSSCATRTASRDLPTPPTPVSVTNRDADSARFTSAAAWRRPTKLVRSPGSVPAPRCVACVMTHTKSRESPA